MSTQEEIYIHFANSIDSLNRAWRILKKIKEQEGNPLVRYTFQLALIEYAKPYKTSYGIEVKHHTLSETYIPKKTS